MVGYRVQFKREVSIFPFSNESIIKDKAVQAFLISSGARSTVCTDRPTCSQNDYYPILEPCVAGKTHTVFVKVQPSVCRDDLSGAVKVSCASLNCHSDFTLQMHRDIF